MEGSKENEWHRCPSRLSTLGTRITKLPFIHLHGGYDVTQAQSSSPSLQQQPQRYQGVGGRLYHITKQQCDVHISKHIQYFIIYPYHTIRIVLE